MAPPCLEPAAALALSPAAAAVGAPAAAELVVIVPQVGSSDTVAGAVPTVGSCAAVLTCGDALATEALAEALALALLEAADELGLSCAF